MQRLIFLAAMCCAVLAQDYQDYQENTPRPSQHRLRPSAQQIEVSRPTPVPILKQINKHNEDGSYTYGYEGADGSFKIETKLATGEVKGKYGYVDETGKVRVVEYGANQYGFQPSGDGITVAPPTLVDETAKEEPEYEDELPPRPQKTYRIQRPQARAQSQPPPPPPPPPQRPQPLPRPHTQPPQYIPYEPEEENEPEPPRRLQFLSQPQQSPAPVQARAQIPGVQRSTDVLYSPVQRPARPEPDYSQSQSFGDGPSNVRISRPVYAPAPLHPAPSSARAHGFLGPASGGRPILEPLQFGHPQAISPRPVSQSLTIQQPQAQPQPQPQPQLRFQSQPSPQPLQPQSHGRSGGGGGGGSLLDQLARDYALPQSNAQPLHDISFGYY